MQNNLRIYTIDREIVEIQFNTAPFATGNDLREHLKDELIHFITPKGNPLRKGKCIFLDERGHENEYSGYFFTITRGTHADIAGLSSVGPKLFYNSLWGERPTATPYEGEGIDLPF